MLYNCYNNYVNLLYKSINITQICYDTCAWTPNKVFMRLGSLGTWAWVPGLGASACRRALRAKRPSTMTVLGTGPVRPGTWATTGNPDPLAIGSWAGQV